jgi:hypothetical protein
VHEERKLIGIQLTVMVSIRTSELHLQKSKYLILRNRFSGRNGSRVILDRHVKDLRR